MKLPTRQSTIALLKVLGVNSVLALGAFWIYEGCPTPTLYLDVEFRSGYAAAEAALAERLETQRLQTRLFPDPGRSLQGVGNTTETGGLVQPTIDSIWVGSDTTPIATYGSSPPAFLGRYPAEGYGATALDDCRDSTLAVWHVTVMTGSGDGTLSAILMDSLSNNKFDIVVFDSAGQYRSPQITFEDKCWMVAGQTGNGPVSYRHSHDSAGQIIRTKPNGRTDDGAIRYMAFRPGEYQWGGQDLDAISINDTAHQIIFDHLSCSYGDDECISTNSKDTFNISQITFQRMLFAYQYKNASLIDESKQVSWHHNVASTADARNPLMDMGGQLETINNVIYNSKARWTYFVESNNGDTVPTHVDVIRIYFKQGPSDAGEQRMVQLDVGSAPYSFTAGGIYVQKIYIDSIKADTTSSDWTYVRWPDNTTADSATYARTTAHRDNVDSAAAIPVTLWSVAETYDSLVVAGQVGANAHLSADGKWVSHRDSIDLQALNDVIYRTTPGYKDSAKHFFEGGTNGYPPLEYLVGANHPDADGNGLPNAFTKRLRNSDTDSTGLAPDSVVGRYGHLAIEAYLWGYFSDVLSIWWQDKTGAEDSTNVLVNGVREDNIAGVAGTGSRFYRGLYEAWSIGDSISFCAWVVADSTCSPPLAIAGDTTKG